MSFVDFKFMILLNIVLDTAWNRHALALAFLAFFFFCESLFEPPFDFPTMAPQLILLLQLPKGLRLQDLLTSY